MHSELSGLGRSYAGVSWIMTCDILSSAGLVISLIYQSTITSNYVTSIDLFVTNWLDRYSIATVQKFSGKLMNG